jgi:hypothetical protein
MDLQWFANNLSGCQARIQGCKWILENHLHPPSHLAQVTVLER